MFPQPLTLTIGESVSAAHVAPSVTESSKVLRIDITFPDLTPTEEKEQATLHLQRELLGTGMIAAENATSDSAALDAKGLHPDKDTLLITLVGSGSLLATVVTTVGGWLVGRKKGTTVKINDEITITDTSDEYQRKLIAELLARHPVKGL
jgi:hypothetical protein